MGTRHTAFILLETNSFVKFCYLLYIKPSDDLESGLITETANKRIGQWLDDIWQTAFDAQNRKQYVDVVIKDFANHFQNWCREFSDDNLGLTDRLLEEIAPYALSNFIQRIEKILGELSCPYDINVVRQISSDNIGKLIPKINF